MSAATVERGTPPDSVPVARKGAKAFKNQPTDIGLVGKQDAHLTFSEHIRLPIEPLQDQLQIGATLASLLCINFGGDGSFDPPCEAPGVRGMVGALATAATCALRLASKQGLPDLPQIAHAAALAKHMEMLHNEELFDGSRGFRQGDMLLSMAFWSIEQMLESACREVDQL